MRSDSHVSAETNREGSSLRSGQSGASAGVPEALAFDKIISGGTCPVRPPRPVKSVAWRGGIGLTRVTALHRAGLYELSHIH